MFSLVVVLSFVAMHFNFSAWFRLGNYAVTTNDFLFGFAILVFLYDVYLGNTQLRFRKNLVMVPFLLFFLFASLSGLQPILGEGGKTVVQFVKTWVHLVEMFLMFVMAFFYDDGGKKLRSLMKWWLVVGLISNLYSLYLIPARPLGWPGAFIHFDAISDGGRSGAFNEGSGQVVLSFGGFFRTTSFFSEPSSLAAFNNLTLLFFIIPKLIEGKFSFDSKLFNTIFFITWIPSQLFTFSLTAVFFLGLSVIAIMYIKGMEFFKRFIPGIIIVALVAVLADFIQSSYTGTSVIEMFSKRITSVLFFDTENFVVGESAFSRFIAYDIAWDIWEVYPWVGVGLGNTYLNGIYELGFFDMSSMAALSETGMQGMLTLVFGLFAFPFIMIKRTKDMLAGKRPEVPLWFVSVYMMAAVYSLVTAMANILLVNHMTSMPLWISLSMIVLAYQQERKYAGKGYYLVGSEKVARKRLMAGIRSEEPSSQVSIS